MKRKTFYLFLIAISLAGLIFGNVSKSFWDLSFLNPEKKAELGQEDLVNLIKPSVVRIVQHIEGTATITPFDIDLKNLTIFPAKKGSPQNFKIDDYIVGSGVVVNPKGYILTNSHVVSYQTIKLQKAQEIGMEVLMMKALFLSEEERNALLEDKDKLSEFGDKMLEYILKESKFETKKTLTVLDPSSTAEKISDAINKGFPAKVVSITDSFYKDNRDAAVIKIEQENLPSAKIADSDKVKIGEKMFVFGFPASATFEKNDFFEATFTQGVVSALKDSRNKEFKIFQTDAKISEGSSGGPLLNSNGEIVGLITYQTGEDLKSTGDNFAFAIPSNEVMKIIKNNYVADASDRLAYDAGIFNKGFLTGISYLEEKKCEKSIGEFSKIKSLNEKFINEKIIDDYIAECRQIISSGESIDNTWEAALNAIKKVHSFFWVLIAIGLMIIFFFIISIFVLARKVKKEEKEIDEMEKQLEEEETEIKSLNKIIKKENNSLMGENFYPTPKKENDSSAEKNEPQAKIIYGEKLKPGTFFQSGKENPLNVSENNKK